MGREGGGICTTCAHLSPSLHIPPLAPPPPVLQYASAFHYLSSAINLKPDFAHSYMYLAITLSRCV